MLLCTFGIDLKTSFDFFSNFPLPVLLRALFLIDGSDTEGTLQIARNLPPYHESMPTIATYQETALHQAMLWQKWQKYSATLPIHVNISPLEITLS